MATKALSRVQQQRVEECWTLLCRRRESVSGSQKFVDGDALTETIEAPLGQNVALSARRLAGWPVAESGRQGGFAKAGQD